MTVLVTDTCKDCAASQINMNALTYEKYLSSATGRVGVTWRKVRRSQEASWLFISHSIAGAPNQATFHAVEHFKD